MSTTTKQPPNIPTPTTRSTPTMAKKRKTSSRAAATRSEPAPLGSSKLTINTYADVADSEDEFLANREMIMLDEGRDAKRRRMAAEEVEGLESEGEEVLALPSSDEEDYDDEDADEDDDMEDDYDTRKPRAASGSDGAASDNEEEVTAWGTSRADFYGADDIDTEQAAIDEEKEALRLQRKHLAALDDADFGLDFATQDDEGEAPDGEDVVTEVLPPLQVPPTMEPTERLELLHSRYPEFAPLAQDLLTLSPELDALAQAAAKADALHRRKSALNAGHPSNPPFPNLRPHPAVVKHRALGAYLGAAAMYFALLTGTADEKGSQLAADPNRMRSHPVMEVLVRCRGLWAKVQELRVPDAAAEEAEVDGVERGLSLAKVEQAVVSDVDEDEQAAKRAARKAKKAAKKATAKQPTADSLRTQEQLARLDADLMDLDTLISRSAPVKPAVNVLDDGENALTPFDAEENAKRKRSLKFYTAQLAQKANKRGAAGREAGGDTDIPRRERLRDRAERLNRDAEKRGKAEGPGADLGGEDEEGGREDGGGDDEYYDLVAKKSKDKKDGRKARAAAEALAAKEGGHVQEVETIGPDGKRGVTYQIAKNKGLTPFRKKEVRNPRVKKRLKFEEKKRKLGSVRAVYKGGEGKGGYKGELTGIKTGIVKGVKL
ncbi:hypothetical protein EJ06DRAFT_581285 [Trichodelitschia bisporula]|uniref:Sas10 C-terminal domain-containing protein n=1 Tax=Trichodelitschia bisporula TaxID=703511 RepID=A0A6G1HYT1_9PEZI|nr:hypothetical protein EJ06DRAFT_581285 [Trichodelitschia bisporula]